MTNDLEQRLTEHFLNKGHIRTFAGRYSCYNLLYFERFNTAKEAIQFEKEIKDWTRRKKEKLVTEFNPNWDFLNSSIMQWPPPKGAISR